MRTSITISVVRGGLVRAVPAYLPDSAAMIAHVAVQPETGGPRG